VLTGEKKLIYPPKLNQKKKKKTCFEIGQNIFSRFDVLTGVFMKPRVFQNMTLSIGKRVVRVCSAQIVAWSLKMDAANPYER